MLRPHHTQPHAPPPPPHVSRAARVSGHYLRKVVFEPGSEMDEHNYQRADGLHVTVRSRVGKWIVSVLNRNA